MCSAQRQQQQAAAAAAAAVAGLRGNRFELVGMQEVTGKNYLLRHARISPSALMGLSEQNRSPCGPRRIGRTRASLEGPAGRTGKHSPRDIEATAAPNSIAPRFIKHRTRRLQTVPPSLFALNLSAALRSPRWLPKSGASTAAAPYDYNEQVPLVEGLFEDNWITR